LENTSPYIAFPIAHLALSSNELIAELEDDVQIGINDGDIYTAYFESDSFTQRKEDLFPKTSFGLPIPIFDSIVTIPVPDVAGLSLSKGILKGDQLIFTFNSTEIEDVSLDIMIPQLSKDGLPFRQNYTIPFDGSAPSTLVTPSIDLAGYAVDFSARSLTFTYDARRTNGDRIVLPLSFAQITAFDFSYLEGSIANTTIPTGLQRIEIDIQDSLVQGSYQFQDPKIHFDVSNSFGIPIAIRVKDVYILLGNDMIPRALESELFDQIIELQYPAFEEQGKVVSERLSFDKLNSNILDLAHNDIVAIDYDLDIIINPKETIDERFFVLDTSRAIITAEVELSFDATVDAVSISKSVPVDLSRLDLLDFLRLKVVVDNGLPLSFEPILVLEDTLVNDEIELVEEIGVRIENALTDNLGEVTGAMSSILHYTLTDDQLGQARLMNRMTATFILKSPNQGILPARIKPGQQLTMRIGAEAKLN